MRGRLGQWHCPKFGSIFYFKHIFHQHLSLSNNQRVKIIQNFPFWHSMRLWQRSPFASILKQGLILSTLLHTCMYVYTVYHTYFVWCKNILNFFEHANTSIRIRCLHLNSPINTTVVFKRWFSLGTYLIYEIHYINFIFTYNVSDMNYLYLGRSQFF